MDGAMMEIGPFRLTHGIDKLELNPGSWHKNANLLFVDQPVGTGLSTTDTDSYLHELPEMAKDMITFLEEYYKIFPERQYDELYIAGESFAGQYIPYLARAILDKNLNKTSPFMQILDSDPSSSSSSASTPATEKPSNNKKKENLQKRSDVTPWLDLKAVLIGNGWIDPLSQYLTYLPFAYQSGLIQHGSAIAAAVEHQHKLCAQYFDTHDNDRAGLAIPVCDKVLDTLLRELFLDTGLPKSDPNACVNVYDIRLRDTYSSCGMNWPQDLDNVTPYLRRTDVLKALHVPTNRGWKECSGPVGSAFKAKHSLPSIDIIPTLIEDQIQVLMFNGDKDLICNHVGNERLIGRLNWGPSASESESGKGPAAAEMHKYMYERDDAESINDKVSGLSRENNGFRPGEESHEWYVDGASAGVIQTGRNLTYLKIYNASHMVPFDLPLVTLAMINQVMEIPGYSQEDQSPKTPSKPSTEVTEESSNDSSNNEDAANQDSGEKEEGDETTTGSWRPYYKAGAYILVVCIIVALFLAFFVWRNRKLTHSALRSIAKGGPGGGRGVHYEDELEDYEAGRLTRGGYSDEDEGFFQSILSGITRWHVPRRSISGGVNSSNGGGKYQHLAGSVQDISISSSSSRHGGNSTIGDGQMEDVPMSSFNQSGKSSRDSLDSILDDLDNTNNNNSSSTRMGSSGSGSNSRQVVVERPENVV